MDSEQPGLVKDVPVHGWGLELDDLRGLFQPKPFHDPVKSFQHRNTHRSDLGQERYSFPDFDHQRELVQQKSQRERKPKPKPDGKHQFLQFWGSAENGRWGLGREGKKEQPVGSQ